MIRTYSSGNRIPFVGRTHELADITARLVDPDCRLLTVTGLGGSGKTRLALEAATTVAAHFLQGTVFVALQPLTRSDLLVPTIAQAVGLTPYSEGDLEQQLLDFLQDKTLLVILDNFEHLLDGATLVTTLLVAAPGLTVLVTSREALHLQEEWLYPLKGMATPPNIYAASIEDITLLVFQPYSLSLLILLACLREDYAEGVLLNELGKRHSTSKMDFQLHYWPLAIL